MPNLMYKDVYSCNLVSIIGSSMALIFKRGVSTINVRANEIFRVLCV